MMTPIQPHEWNPFKLTTIYEAMKVAELRHTSSAVLKLNPDTTYKSNYLEFVTRNINSVLAEFVIGRRFDSKFLPKLNVFHEKADVEEDIEVRSTPKHRDYTLFIRDNDDIARRYVLVICDALKGYVVKGWVYGYEAATDEWWVSEPKNGCDRPAWFYKGPLRPWSTLTKERPSDAKMDTEKRW
jgi:hypothetical protein